MNKLSRYSQTITKHYPELAVKSATFNQDGQYNDVVIINDDLIFRFAKVKPAIQSLRQEIAVLNHIKNRVTCQVPDPIYSNLETDVLGEAFMGYPIIPGIPLWRANFKNITSKATRKQMALQLAGFLKDLHSVPVDSIQIGINDNDSNQKWEDMYHRIRKNLFPHMRTDATAAVSMHFESFLKNPDRFNFNPCLRHGDFGTGNILFDPETSSISGILDFGSVSIGDPATDFAGLYISFGETFYRFGLAEYPEMEPALDRVQFYCGTFALQEALFGFENGDADAFTSGMATYV